MTIIREKSHVSSIKEEVNESTPHPDKGKKRLMSPDLIPLKNDRDRPREDCDRDYEYDLHVCDIPEPTGRPRVWDSMGG